MTADVTISCPHCRRQYTMKIDPERLQRLKTRATCGRCGNTFDVASRIASASQETITEPKLRRVEAPPPAAQLVPTMKTPALAATTEPDLRDEMEELAREFAEAAARFTPVGVKRSTLGLSAEPPPAKPALEEPTKPGVKPQSLQQPAEPTAPTTPDAGADVAAAYDQLALEAEPAGEDEFTTAPPTLSRVTVPKSWLELADPGLASLQSPPSAGAAALEALLHESETIALPLPPAAS